MIVSNFEDVRDALLEQREVLGMSIENKHDRDRFLLLTAWLKTNAGGTLLISGTFQETSPDLCTFDVTGEPLLVERFVSGGKIIVTDEEAQRTFTIQPVLHAGVNFYLRR